MQFPAPKALKVEASFSATGKVTSVQSIGSIDILRIGWRKMCHQRAYHIIMCGALRLICLREGQNVR